MAHVHTRRTAVAAFGLALVHSARGDTATAHEWARRCMSAAPPDDTLLHGSLATLTAEASHLFPHLTARTWPTTSLHLTGGHRAHC